MTQKKIATIMPFLKQPHLEPTPSDYLKMVSLASYIAKLEKKGGLTRDQIYTLTNLSALLNAKMEKCYQLLSENDQKFIQKYKPPEMDNDIREFQNTLNNLHDKNNKLNLKLNHKSKSVDEDFSLLLPKESKQT